MGREQMKRRRKKNFGDDFENSIVQVSTDNTSTDLD